MIIHQKLKAMKKLFVMAAAAMISLSSASSLMAADNHISLAGPGKEVKKLKKERKKLRHQDDMYSDKIKLEKKKSKLAKQEKQFKKKYK